MTRAKNVPARAVPKIAALLAQPSTKLPPGWLSAGVDSLPGALAEGVMEPGVGAGGGVADGVGAAVPGAGLGGVVAGAGDVDGDGDGDGVGVGVGVAGAGAGDGVGDGVLGAGAGAVGVVDGEGTGAAPGAWAMQEVAKRPKKNSTLSIEEFIFFFFKDSRWRRDGERIWKKKKKKRELFERL